MSDIEDTKAEPFAFPSQIGFGMTLRDYFAGQALSVIPSRAWANPDGEIPSNIFELWAKSSYAAADAMLAERAK